ncbi:DoxX family membrane protein [Bacillus cereus]|uniref:DoxX family membrane protein n=1 Tax=Bacillus cereus TaxID=1396 RepID=UPI000BEE6A5A|nr:DoxX family membrane protein [Bacillus cereus]PEF61867.1 hypothetical protein CON35_23055 [Bacillus cereus]
MWNTIARNLFSIIRIGLGISWVQQGWFKLHANFGMSGFIEPLLHNNDVPDWFKSLMGGFVTDHIKLFEFIIPWGEFLVGIGLITGILTLPALLTAIFMNINYWLADMVYIYPLQLATATVILAGIRYASYIGLQTGFIYFYRKKRMDLNNT